MVKNEIAFQNLILIANSLILKKLDKKTQNRLLNVIELYTKENLIKEKILILEIIIIL